MILNEHVRSVCIDIGVVGVVTTRRGVVATASATSTSAAIGVHHERVVIGVDVGSVDIEIRVKDVVSCGKAGYVPGVIRAGSVGTRPRMVSRVNGGVGRIDDRVFKHHVGTEDFTIHVRCCRE